jgi:hypothetical protein
LFETFLQHPTPAVDAGGVDEYVSCETAHLVVPPTGGFSPKAGV